MIRKKTSLMAATAVRPARSVCQTSVPAAHRPVTSAMNYKDRARRRVDEMGGLHVKRTNVKVTLLFLNGISLTGSYLLKKAHREHSPT